MLKVDPTSRTLTVFRQGGVSVQQLGGVLGAEWTVQVMQRHVRMEHTAAAATAEEEVQAEGRGQEAPGQAITHYAPDVPCYLVRAAGESTEAQGGEEQVLEQSAAELCGAVVLDFGGQLARAHSSLRGGVLAYRELSRGGVPKEAAAQLFDALRWAELQTGATTVLIACPPVQGGAGVEGEVLLAGVVDRMHRAASGRTVSLVLA